MSLSVLDAGNIWRKQTKLRCVWDAIMCCIDFGKISKANVTNNNLNCSALLKHLNLKSLACYGLWGIETIQRQRLAFYKFQINKPVQSQARPVVLCGGDDALHAASRPSIAPQRGLPIGFESPGILRRTGFQEPQYPLQRFEFAKGFTRYCGFIDYD